MAAPSTLVWLTRAAHLMLLAAAPRTLSPEPLPPEPVEGYAAASAAALVGVVALAWVFRKRMDGYRGATAAAIFASATVATACFGAAFWSGARAPLARGVPFVALPEWATFAATGCALADRWLGSTFRHRRAAAITVVLAFGARVLTSAAGYLGSQETMWRSALRRDGRHARALDELLAPHLRAGEMDEVRRIVNQCLNRNPDAPACIAARADLDRQSQTR